MTLPAVTEGVYPVTDQNLLLYRIAAFDAYPYLRHAIFTRQGGYSQAPFASLNLGISVGDDPEAVKKIMSRFAGCWIFRPTRLFPAT
ncbi:MAG: hypothetical protein HC875_25075 [Anaerolineales bacterium]|nr:hypothetical protein [Anaerolineales bacterium]